ncbi:MAG: hypothetical protein RIT45_1471 [Pseudomonadota bacterium]|jgi:acetyl esterase
MAVTMVESLRRALAGRGWRAALALPPALRRRIFGTPPRNDRGEPFDDDAHVLATLSEWIQPPLNDIDVRRSRDGMRRGTALVSRPIPADVQVSERVHAGRPARLYRPAATTDRLLVYYHGGGWVLGDLDTHDGLCARLAAELPAQVLSIDYRLAPEHPCPAAFEDALAAFRAARDAAATFGCAPDRVAVGGDSAGGNLAAAVSMACRGASEPMPAAQLLIYPATDLRRLTASHQTCANGPMLTGDDVQFFLDAYAPSDLLDPRVSPGAAASLQGLPPAVVTTCGFDPLRDEGEDYARRLAEAGVPTRHLHHSGLPHGYASMDAALPAADRAVAAAIAAFRVQFGTK